MNAYPVDVNVTSLVLGASVVGLLSSVVVAIYSVLLRVRGRRTTELKISLPDGVSEISIRGDVDPKVLRELLSQISPIKSEESSAESSNGEPTLEPDPSRNPDDGVGE